MPSIHFQGVTKIYSRQSREFFWRFLLEALGSGKTAPHYALRNATFQFSAGDAVGVVGHNGAGKTTLLNLVARLTVPEEGVVRVEGRVAAMMELGSGFHPDLTGTENLRINAALHGLSARQTEEAFAAIIEFSELGDFIHEPLRTYSQGMILRLAFSVTVSTRPDILLIDELLAVGDEGFQRKCFARLRQLRDAGTILLCVSHYPDVLREVCHTAMWLDQGRIVQVGPLDQVVASYRSG